MRYRRPMRAPSAALVGLLLLSRKASTDAASVSPEPEVGGSAGATDLPPPDEDSPDAAATPDPEAEPSDGETAKRPEAAERCTLAVGKSEHALTVGQFRSPTGFPQHRRFGIGQRGRFGFKPASAVLQSRTEHGLEELGRNFVVLPIGGLGQPS